MKKLVAFILVLFFAVTALAADWELTDPAADKLIGWDDSASAVVFFGLGTGLTTSATPTLDLHASLVSIAGLTETNGGIPYGTADNAYAWLAAGGAGKLLMGGEIPSWSAFTLAAPGAAGGMLLSDGTNWTRATTLTGLTFDLGTPSVGANEIVTVDANGVVQMSALVWPTGLDMTELSYVNGVTSAIQTQINAKLSNSVYNAHTVLYATTDDTPAALTVGEQTVVGRATSGNIAAIAIDSDLASTSANNDTVPSAKAVKNKIQYKSWSFDPKAVCDGAVDRLFLMSAHGGQGIIVTKWAISFEDDPTTEVDLDLKRADAWIGVANAAVMDALDTTNGAASEATPANINGGAAVAEGKVIYLEFATAYTEANHQIIFEMWFYEVGN